MSQLPQLPLHLADFDYNDPAKVKEYALATKRIEAIEAAWSVIEAKAIALTKITDDAERKAAVADLEALRAAAYSTHEKYQVAISVLLPDPPPMTEDSQS